MSQEKIKVILSVGQIMLYSINIEKHMWNAGYTLKEMCIQFRIISYRVVFLRANMPDKAAEEKALLAKKLAEQRAKGIEGIPTTAKVRF